MNHVICAVLFFSVITVAHAVMYKDCGSENCKITSVGVEGCTATAMSCDFHRGTTVNMTMTFNTIVRAKDLKSSIQGNIRGTWVPFSSSDACNSITPTCPIAANTGAKFQISVVVSKLYPEISLPIKIELKDSTGGECTCFMVQGKIV